MTSQLEGSGFARCSLHVLPVPGRVFSIFLPHSSGTVNWRLNSLLVQRLLVYICRPCYGLTTCPDCTHLVWYYLQPLALTGRAVQQMDGELLSCCCQKHLCLWPSYHSATGWSCISIFFIYSNCQPVNNRGASDWSDSRNKTMFLFNNNNKYVKLHFTFLTSPSRQTEEDTSRVT